MWTHGKAGSGSAAWCNAAQLIIMPGLHYLARAETADGYPAKDFEEWYQQGLNCFDARLPKNLRKQALLAQDKSWTAKGGTLQFWMLRAFAYGAAGRDSNGNRLPSVSSGYLWPTPPDAAWQLVVCCYPNGGCDLDFLHPVSRKFWSDDNDLLTPPDNPGVYTRNWYGHMGFDVIVMNPSGTVTLGMPTRHLALV